MICRMTHKSHYENSFSHISSPRGYFLSLSSSSSEMQTKELQTTIKVVFELNQRSACRFYTVTRIYFNFASEKILNIPLMRLTHTHTH